MVLLYGFPPADTDIGKQRYGAAYSMHRRVWRHDRPVSATSGSCVQKAGELVLVAGSTGGVGQIAVAKLTEQGFKVRALTRSKAKGQELFGSSSDVEVVEVDLRDKAALEAAAVFDGCAAAIVAIGTTAFPSSRCAAVAGT
jgi:NADPH:quinone reductase-like Zn-dependent oxidoreductase